MGICCSKAAAGEQDDDDGLGFPWMHDDLFDHHLWASAGVSVHTKQGWKGANQDAMTVSQDFAGHKGHIFCGVFDGHGPLGREVARHVRDALPVKLASALKPKNGDADSLSNNLKHKPEEDDSSNNLMLKPSSNSLKLKPEEDDSSNNLKLKPEDDSNNSVKLEPEEDHSSNSLKLRTEEDPSSNNLKLATEEEDSSNTLKLKPEEDDSSNNLKLKPEEDESNNSLMLKPEEDDLNNSLMLKPEEDDSNNNLMLKPEEDHSSNSLKEDDSTNSLKLRTEEDPSSDSLKLTAEEDTSNNNLKLTNEQDDSSNSLNLKPEEDNPSNSLKLRTEEDPATNSVKLRTEEDPSSNTDLDSFDKSDSSSFSEDTSDESQLLSTWKNIFVKTFEQVDEELRQNSGIDCICSGTTAVVAFRQGDHLIVANLGDSRAVLCTRDSKDRLIPVQLTTDLKPDLPSELARILNCKGRVFALDDEPDVPRMWLPDQDAPGLAMARAFGDFCLKNHGLICTPEVYCRKLSEKDEFLVLATDGIWDVLSNKEVVKVVSSATDPSKAARQLVDRAVRAWRRKYPTSMVDDCAVVCLYLSRRASPGSEENLRVPGTGRDDGVKPPAVPFTGSSFRRALSNGGEASEEGGATVWRALEGVARANSVIRLPRLGRVLSWRRRSSSLDEDGGVDRD